MELKKDGSLILLDTLLTRKKDRSIDIEVYQKNTHTDQYLHYNSHHPQHVKRGVASCLFSRARTVAMGENVGKEVKHITEVLKANGYPESNWHRNPGREKRKRRNPSIQSAYHMYQD